MNGKLQDLAVELYQARIRFSDVCARIRGLVKDRSYRNMVWVWENEVETPTFVRRVQGLYSHRWRAKLRSMRKIWLSVADDPPAPSPFRLLRRNRKRQVSVRGEDGAIVNITLRGGEDEDQIESCLASVLSVARRMGLDYAQIAQRAIRRVQGMGEAHGA